MKSKTARCATAVFAKVAAIVLISCSLDSAVVVPVPVLTTIAVTVPATSLVPGQMATAAAAGKDVRRCQSQASPLRYQSDTGQ
jgi:hypothetical protein